MPQLTWWMMKKSIKALFVYLGVIVFLVPLVAFGVEEKPLTAQEIVARALERNSFGFEAGYGKFTLEVYDRAGEKQERRLDVRSRRDDGGGQTLVTLTHPAEVRGQAFLFTPDKDKEGVEENSAVWMYVPAFNVIRPIEGSQKRGAFLGTHFTYADLEYRDLKKATYRLLSPEKIQGDSTFVIEARPTDDAQSDYARIIGYVRESDFMPLRFRFFDRENKLDKTLIVEVIEEGEEGKAYAGRMTIRSERGGYTTLILKALDQEAIFSDDLFNPEELGR